jgi:hypothetical protein
MQHHPHVLAGLIRELGSSLDLCRHSSSPATIMGSASSLGQSTSQPVNQSSSFADGVGCCPSGLVDASFIDFQCVGENRAQCS